MVYADRDEVILRDGSQAFTAPLAGTLNAELVQRGVLVFDDRAFPAIAGDGVTDDSAAIAAAIAALPAGGTLRFTRPAYRARAIIITGKNQFTLDLGSARLEVPDGSALASTSTTPSATVARMFRFVNCDDVRITGGVLWGNRETVVTPAGYDGDGHAIGLDFRGCARVRVQGTRVEAFATDGIHLGHDSAAGPCRGFRVDDAELVSCNRWGAAVSSGEDVVFVGCAFTATPSLPCKGAVDLERGDSAALGYVVRRIRLVACQVDGCQQGIFVTEHVSDVAVTGCGLANYTYALGNVSHGEQVSWQGCTFSASPSATTTSLEVGPSARHNQVSDCSFTGGSTALQGALRVRGSFCSAIGNSFASIATTANGVTTYAGMSIAASDEGDSNIFVANRSANHTGAYAFYTSGQDGVWIGNVQQGGAGSSWRMVTTQPLSTVFSGNHFTLPISRHSALGTQNPLVFTGNSGWRRETWRAAVPTEPAAGPWTAGDRVWNQEPAVGEPAGWIVTTPGLAHRPSTGTLTAGSPVVSGVTNADTWSVGNLLRASAGLPAGGATVTAVDPVAGTVTLSANATANAGGATLFDAVFSAFGVLS